MIEVKEKIDEETIKELLEERRHLAGLVYEVNAVMTSSLILGVTELRGVRILMRRINATFGEGLPDNFISAEDIIKADRG